MTYLCGRCIHFDVCYVPRSIGCVEICGHFKEEPKEPLTEQEYLQTCDTEQLAEWVVSTNRCKKDHLCCVCRQKWCDKKYVVEWLKQPHTKGGES